MITAQGRARECFVKDVKYPSDISSNKGATSPKECQQVCVEHAECEFWTYNPSNNFCFLNQGFGGASGFESTPETVGLVSGPKQGCHVNRRRLADRLMR